MLRPQILKLLQIFIWIMLFTDCWKVVLIKLHSYVIVLRATELWIPVSLKLLDLDLPLRWIWSGILIMRWLGQFWHRYSNSLNDILSFYHVCIIHVKSVMLAYGLMNKTLHFPLAMEIKARMYVLRKYIHHVVFQISYTPLWWRGDSTFIFFRNFIITPFKFSPFHLTCAPVIRSSSLLTSVNANVFSH